MTPYLLFMLCLVVTSRSLPPQLPLSDDDFDGILELGTIISVMASASVELTLIVLIC